MAKRYWTKAETDFLRENHLTMTNLELSNHLGHYSCIAIGHKLNRLGLVRDELRPKAGDKFGRLTILEINEKRIGKRNRKSAKVICDCGTICEQIDISSMVIGNTTSCGCYFREMLRVRMAKQAKTHGLSKHKLYKTYRQMIGRCYRSSHHSWMDYGGRGIDVCKIWLDDFMSFYEWSLSNGWDSSLTIDRIDNNKGYSPENCRWADFYTQGNNRRSNVFFTAFGETKTVTEWSRDDRCKISLCALRVRIKSGKLSPEMMLSLSLDCLHEQNSLKITAFGKTMILSEWVKEKECVVAMGTLHMRVFDYGWEPERAITEKAMRKEKFEPVLAFGEYKTPAEWAKDSRSKAPYLPIYNRIRKGWSPEEAITTPVRKRTKSQKA